MIRYESVWQLVLFLVLFCLRSRVSRFCLLVPPLLQLLLLLPAPEAVHADWSSHSLLIESVSALLLIVFFSLVLSAVLVPDIGLGIGLKLGVVDVECAIEAR